MRIAVPHTLGKDEARRRLRERSHELSDHLPAFATSSQTWRDEDTLALSIGAMGQNIDGDVKVEDAALVFELTLPPMLSFIEPMVEKTIRSNGEKLLEPPKE